MRRRTSERDQRGFTLPELLVAITVQGLIMGALGMASIGIMRGGTQANWLHQVPKTAKPVKERLNLTFRRIVAPAK